VWIKLGKCRHHDQRYVEAWEAYNNAKALFSKVSEQMWPGLEQEIAEGLSQIPTIKFVFQSRPDKLSVQLDGVDLSGASLDQSQPVQLGRHQIVARAPGYLPFSDSIDVREKKVYSLTLALQTASPPPENPHRAEHSLAVDASGSPNRTTSADAGSAGRQNVKSPIGARRVVGYAAAGIGLAGLSVATYELVHSIRLIRDSNQFCNYHDGSCDYRAVNLRDDAARAQNVAIVASSVGLVGLVAGAYLLLAVHDADPRAIHMYGRGSFAIVPEPGGVSWRYSW
jgi:hypothetical protein